MHTYSLYLDFVTNTFLDALKQICKEYFDRMYQCESQKYDMEFEVRKRGFEVKKKIGI